MNGDALDFGEERAPILIRIKVQLHHCEDDHQPTAPIFIFYTISARIEERKGKLIATLASQFLNLHDWSTSNLHINSSSTCYYKQSGGILERVGHNTHFA